MSRIQASVAILITALAPVVAGAAGSVPDSVNGACLPATPEAWLAQMLDAKKNGVAFKDPAAFVEWLDAVTEPRFMTALASVAVEPATYPKAMADAVDPAAIRNWSEFTDPQLYLRWLLASATPSFQQAIIRKMTDPGKVKRWFETASRPDGYAAMLAAFGRAPMAWYGSFAGMGQQAAGQEWLKRPADKAPGVTDATGVRYRY